MIRGDAGPRAEGRGQRAEGREQRTEGSWQLAAGRGKEIEVREKMKGILLWERLSPTCLSRA